MKFLDQILGIKEQFKREHKKNLFSEIVGYDDLIVRKRKREDSRG